MRTNLFSRTLSIVLLIIAIIIFARPHTALGQLTSDSVLAVSNAQREAKADVNTLLWTVVGLIGTSSCTLVGIYAGLHIGDSISQSHSGGRLFPGNFLADEAIKGACIGSMVGWSAPFIPIYMYKSVPAPQRLIGKSPEYVYSYTKTYKSEVRKLRMISAVKGGCGGCLFTFVITLLQLQ